MGNATIGDLMLERGTIPTDWMPSPHDNDKSLAEFQAVQYLRDAIKEGDTSILGGLILSNMIILGNYKNGAIQKVTAGMSGIYNDDDDVAFWGGGTLEQAIATVMKFKQNPFYQPTEREWADLANFVTTHGGDIFLRGYIHALGGRFRGDVIAESGIFKNVKSPNGNFSINDDGDVEIKGKVVSNFNGNRIILDPETRTIKMIASYNTRDVEVLNMEFVEDEDSKWAYGIINMTDYSVLVDEYGNERPLPRSSTTIKPGSISSSSGTSNLNISFGIGSNIGSGILNTGRLVNIYSDSWPTVDDVTEGYIYNDNGILKIK
jgi:hypothetical protein